MKKLLPLLILALLFTGCTKKPTETPDFDDSQPTIVEAPYDPSRDTTTAAPKVETTADTSSEAISSDSSSSETSAPVTLPATSAAEVVKPVPMTYRLQYEADGLYYLLDADYSMSIVEPEGDPVFHKSVVTNLDSAKIVYCSDLDTSLVLDSDGKVLTKTQGQLKSPIDGHWFLYLKADAGNYRLYSLESGETFSGAVRGYHTRTDGQIALLGEKSIYVSDGERLTDTRDFSIIYYFAAGHILVREDEHLRFYTNEFDLLADWGEISGSNRIHFDETVRNGDSFTFVFDEGSFSYEPESLDDAELVAQNLAGDYKLYRKDGKFYLSKGGKTFATDLPDIDIILVNAEKDFVQLVDRDYTHYLYTIGGKTESLGFKLKVGDVTVVDIARYGTKSYVFDKNGTVIYDSYDDIIGAVNGKLVILTGDNASELALMSLDGKLAAKLGSIAQYYDLGEGRSIALVTMESAYDAATQVYTLMLNGMNGDNSNAVEIVYNAATGEITVTEGINLLTFTSPSTAASELDLIATNAEPSFVQLVDRDFNHYYVMIASPYETRKLNFETVVKLGDATAVNCDDPEFKSFLFDKNSELIASEYAAFYARENAVICERGLANPDSYLGNIVDGRFVPFEKAVDFEDILYSLGGHLVVLGGDWGYELELVDSTGTVAVKLGSIAPYTDVAKGVVFVAHKSAYDASAKTYKIVLGGMQGDKMNYFEFVYNAATGEVSVTEGINP